MLVLSDIQTYVVVIDWILHQPIPTRVAVAKVGLAHELSVRYINKVFRNFHADAHRLDFVFPLVLVGPPDARAFSFARRVDPRPANGIFAEGDATEPAGLERIARVVEVDLVHTP